MAYNSHYDYGVPVEDIFSNPDEEDQNYIAMYQPVEAIRLYNFPTGFANLLLAHKKALDQVIEYILTLTPETTGVYLYGYASNTGGMDVNYLLSQNRCLAVQKYIQNQLPDVIFSIVSQGASVSTGPSNDDNGYWRSVKVFVREGVSRFAPSPNPLPPPPPPPIRNYPN
jgi:outer membrane protein OmpA-like peptidoglycan-associated protein